MKLLLVIDRKPCHKFLVELKTRRDIDEVTDDIARRRRSKAMMTALSKGRIIGCYSDWAAPDIRADLILKEDGCSWDLML